MKCTVAFTLRIYFNLFSITPIDKLGFSWYNTKSRSIARTVGKGKATSSRRSEGGIAPVSGTCGLLFNQATAKMLKPLENTRLFEV